MLGNPEMAPEGAGAGAYSVDPEVEGLDWGRRLPAALVGAVWACFGLFVIWRLMDWGSSADTRESIVDAALVVPGIVASLFAWGAARRCGEPRTRSAWHWISVSMALITATFAINLGYQLVSGVVPFPSAADTTYLLSYPTFLIGILRFPMRPESRAGNRRLWVDLATVGLAGASVIWFFVVGPTVLSSGQAPLAGAVAGAYPVGDLLLIFVLAYVMSRVDTASSRKAILLLGASTLSAMVGDVSNGWMRLHPHYELQAAVDITFMAGWAFFLLAGLAQARVASRPPQERGIAASVGDGWMVRAGWLPYLAPTVVFGLLVVVQFGGSFGDRVSLTIGSALVSLLVLLRQFLARRDLLSAQDQLRYRALHDGLTRLPNRTLVLDRIEQLLAHARRQRKPIAALFVDVDGFKHVNDTFGHACGDELLKVIAERLCTVVRDGDTVGRLAGDEFVVLLDDLDVDAAATLVAERVLEVLRQPIELPQARERRLSITVSIGVAVTEAGTADELLHAADLALYEAKNAGRNRFVLFEADMQTVAHDRLLLELDLSEALERDELFLVYQPLFDLRTDTITGVEALARWRHPRRGVVSPGDFIPIAEDSGLILPIGRWVLRSACRQAAEWHRSGRPIEVAVNVSARQLDSDDLLDDVRRALSDTALTPSKLTLEITESVLMKNPSAAVHRLEQLKQLGVRIAIDDFGTGYSSLAYLRQFPVDALKIDRSFIAAIGASAEAGALIHTLVQLGKSLNLRTLGEGIEELSQLQVLKDEDCELGQGFLLARPSDAAAIERLLSNPVLSAAA